MRNEIGSINLQTDDLLIVDIVAQKNSFVFVSEIVDVYLQQ